MSISMHDRLTHSHLIIRGIAFSRDEFIEFIERGASPNLDGERYWDDAVFDLITGVGNPMHVYQELAQVLTASMEDPSEWELLAVLRRTQGRDQGQTWYGIIINVNPKENDDHTH